MKTKIKTKDLLKVINPFVDGITFKGQHITPSFEELKEYIKKPTENNLFDKSDDLVEDFYKNVALYILNSTNTPKYISLDLDKQNPFDSGLFEYITNIYKNTPFSYIELDNNANNDILIKTKQLDDITEELELNKIKLVKATDTYMSGYTSTFYDAEKITSNNKFFWKNDSQDLYSDLDFILRKIDSIKFSQINAKENFYSIINMANPEIIETDEFKLALLDSERSSKLLVMLLENNDPETFSLDFSTQLVQDFLLARIKENDFEVFIILMQEYFGLQSQKNSGWNLEGIKKHALNNEKINWSLLLNQPETLDYLIKYSRDSTSSSYYTDDCNFTVVNCYQFFDEKNKRNPYIVNKYLERITSYSSYSSSDRIDQDKLFELPLDLFQEEFFINTVSSSIDFTRLKKELSKQNITPTSLADPEVIVKQSRITEQANIASWIKNFLKKSQINKEFLIKVLEENGQFFNSMLTDSVYKKYCTDFELIAVASKKGFSLDKLDKSFIKNALIQDSNNPEHEQLKLEYVITNSLFNSAKTLYDKPEDVDRFKEKYIKPEYAFLRTNQDVNRNRFYETEQRTKIIGKIKTREAVLDTLKKIKPLATSYYFESNQFYLSLNSELKKDAEIVEKLLELNPFSYYSLDESLKFNSNLALKFLNIDIANLEHIRNEFFNDVNFSLEFTKIMDKYGISSNEQIIPAFITKFFENQEITEGYHSYLSKYLAFNSLKETVAHKDEPKTKKLKI